MFKEITETLMCSSTHLGNQSGLHTVTGEKAVWRELTTLSADGRRESNLPAALVVFVTWLLRSARGSPLDTWLTRLIFCVCLVSEKRGKPILPSTPVIDAVEDFAARMWCVSSRWKDESGRC